jgi:hypothetical protein
MAPSDQSQFSKYYPTLQSVLSDVQSIVPPGQSSNNQQQAAVQSLGNQYTAESSEFRNKMSSSLEDQVDKYIDITHRLNDYNEIYNTNTYIYKELNKEQNRLGDFTNRLKNKIYISKQKSQMYEYETNKMKFYRNLFLVSCGLIIVLLMCASANITQKISSKLFYVILFSLTLVYVIAVSAFVYSNSFRSHTDWNKFYWGNIKNNKATPQCSST